MPARDMGKNPSHRRDNNPPDGRGSGPERATISSPMAIPRAVERVSASCSSSGVKVAATAASPSGASGSPAAGLRCNGIKVESCTRCDQADGDWPPVRRRHSGRFGEDRRHRSPAAALVQVMTLFEPTNSILAPAPNWVVNLLPDPPSRAPNMFWLRSTLTAGRTCRHAINMHGNFRIGTLTGNARPF